MFPNCCDWSIHIAVKFIKETFNMADKKKMQFNVQELF